MAYESARKTSEIKHIHLILLVFVLAILSFGCDPCYNEYPYDKESEWFCY